MENPGENAHFSSHAVASLGGGGPPEWHPPGRDSRGKKFLRANLQRIVDKRGRTGKNVWGNILQEGDIRVKSVKVTVVSVFFQETINRGDTGELGDGDD